MELKELIEAVKAATGPDREVDAVLFERVDSEFPVGAVQMHNGFVDPAIFATGAYTSVKAPLYTLSIDAALALVERCLPGWRFALYTNGGGKGPACLAMVGDEPVKADVRAPTLPLAIILALLTALDQKEENK